MKISKEINAPATFVYTKLMDSSLFDIHKQTGKKLTIKQLKNFEYIKTFSKSQKARIKIVDVVENSVYSFHTSTKMTDYITTYSVEPTGESSCIATCEETKTSKSFFQNLNDMFVGFLLGPFKKKQIIAIFDEIGKEYNGR